MKRPASNELYQEAYKLVVSFSEDKSHPLRNAPLSVVYQEHLIPKLSDICPGHSRREYEEAIEYAFIESK